MNNYNGACTEVSTILNYLNIEEYKKIPKEVIEVIERNKNNDYIFNFDENVELRKQKLLKETRAILFNLFRDYLATKEQKEKIIQMQKEERYNINETKKQIYDNNIFGNKIQTQEKKNKETMTLVDIKKQGFIIKIVNKIKKFF